MNKFLLSLIVASLSSESFGRVLSEDRLDYRYKTDNGHLAYCVSCLVEDAERNRAESLCIDKNLPGENKTVDGELKTFHPICFNIGHVAFPRYIKNCTGPPEIHGGTPDCSSDLYLVHETCNVKCNDSRMDPTDKVTTCDPRSGTWTDVRCEPARCSPLSTIIGTNENSTCNVASELPLTTQCRVSCPSNYDQNHRVLECKAGRWEVTQPCAAVIEKGFTWSQVVLPLSVGIPLLVVVLVAVLIVGCLWWKRKKGQNGSDSGESIVQEVSGSTDNDPPPYSFVDEEKRLSITCVPEKQPLLGSGTGSEPDYTPSEMCRELEVWYKIDNDAHQRLPESFQISVRENASLTLYAACAPNHNIVQFYHGAFSYDNLQTADHRITLRVQRRDAGSYIICAKCDHRGEVFSTVHINVSDNPDCTNVKRPYMPEDDLGSLAQTVSLSTVTAGSEGSGDGNLKAEPPSLSSNPTILGSQDLSSHRISVAAAGSKLAKHRCDSVVSLAQSLPDMDDDDEEVQDCTLLLSELQKHHFHKYYDKLCEMTEPINSRLPGLTMGGATLAILKYSHDKLENIICAKQTDLRNTPARTLVSLMMQAGKRTIHLVRYFSMNDHCHRRAVNLLKQAHPGCPSCSQY